MSEGTLGDLVLVADGVGTLTAGEIWSWPKYVPAGRNLRQFIVVDPVRPEPMIPKLQLTPLLEVTNRHARRQRAAMTRRRK